MSRDAGAGALLGLAAGEQGAGPAYGYRTQLAIVIAYELLNEGHVRESGVRRRLLAMGGSERSVFRHPPQWLTLFLDREGRAGAGPGPYGGAGGATRSVPIGLWHRQHPADLLADAVQAATATHTDAQSIVLSCATAAAVAGTSFGQSGRDLIAGVLEAASSAVPLIESDERLEGDARPTLRLLERGLQIVGRPADQILAELEAAPDSAAEVVAGLVMAAPLTDDPFRTVGRAIELNRRGLTAVVGAVTGTRLGLVKWPWSIANDTWFAEIGRRLVARHQMAADLPDPYEVEDRLSHGPPAGLG
jgi:ADP-ribosylglycohydrolase